MYALGCPRLISRHLLNEVKTNFVWFLILIAQNFKSFLFSGEKILPIQFLKVKSLFELETENFPNLINKYYKIDYNTYLFLSYK